MQSFFGDFTAVTDEKIAAGVSKLEQMFIILYDTKPPCNKFLQGIGIAVEEMDDAVVNLIAKS